ncbi:MAG: sugar-binding protein [Prolixibacteraceae bacterium]
MKPKNLLFIVGLFALLSILSYQVNAAGQVISFTLMNADTNEEITVIQNTTVLNLYSLSENLNIRANTNGEPVGSVVFDWDGVEKFKIETTAPYALGGDDAGSYRPFEISTGQHVLKGTAYSEAGGNGTAGETILVAFNVIDQYERDRVQIFNNTVVTDERVPLRGGPMVCVKGHENDQVIWALDTLNWIKAKNEGHLNTMRIVTDRWHKAQGYDHYSIPELIEKIDSMVDIAAKYGFYAIVNFHDVSQYIMADVEEFWTAIAPRYANRTHVMYEMLNEPTRGSDINPNFYESNGHYDNFKKIYDLIRFYAPDTHIMLFSFQSCDGKLKETVDGLKGIDYTKSSVAFHMYGNSSKDVAFLKMNYPVICTEWDYPGSYDYVRQIDGELYNGQTLERLGISWLDWRAGRWNASFVSEFLEAYKIDAIDKGYWWELDQALGSDNTPPTTPTGLALTSVSGTSATLSWNASTDDNGIGGYILYANGESIARSTATKVTVFGLKPATSYKIRVSAYDLDGNESTQGAPLEMTTLDIEGDALIGKTLDFIEVDGTKDECYSGAVYPIENELYRDNVSPENLSGEWTAVWDVDYIYFYISAKDSEKYNDSGENWYYDDGAEIYIDGDNSKSTDYDANDFQFAFKWNELTAMESKHKNVEGVLYSMADTDDGYNMEVAIPWTLIGIEAEENRIIGLDVQLNDDDDGDLREGKMAWFAQADDSWKDTKLFANALLTGELAVGINSKANTNQIRLEKKGHIIHISNMYSSAYSYQVLDVMGRLVDEGKASSNNKQIDTSAFSNKIHILKVWTGTGVSKTLKFIP